MFSYLCTEYTVFTLHIKGSRYCWQILGKYSCITSIQLSFCEINILHAVVPLVSKSKIKHRFGRKLAELSLKHITYCHVKEHITCIQEFSTDMHIIAKQKKNNRNVNVALQKHLSIHVSAFYHIYDIIRTCQTTPNMLPYCTIYYLSYHNSSL